MNRLVWLWIGLLGSAGCASAPYPRAFTHPAQITSRQLVYSRIQNQELHLELHHPRHQRQRQPVLLWVHGGGWFRGNPSPCPIAWLARHGYTVIGVQYRLLNAQTRFPAPLEDLHTALAWIRAHPDLCRADPKSIGLVGASAGGLLASLLAADPGTRLNCVVTFFPVTDPARLLCSGEQIDWRMRFAVRQLLRARDPASADPGLLRQVNARGQISARAPPQLIVHGTADRWIPARHSYDYVAALRAIGVDGRLCLVNGFGHGDPRIATSKVQEEVIEFLEQYLK